jgi:exopolyphosphatase/guanosine-5'-triphosphate,3'-diphosphate pyrophosphatase
MLKFVFLFFVLSCSSVIHQTSECVVTRGAFDIGSGSSKVVFARVNLCKGKIESILFEDQEVLKFKANIHPRTYTFSKKLVARAKKTLRSWKKKGEELQVSYYEGVATEVFRQAVDGEKVIKELSNAINVPIAIISQKDEAMYGFWAGATLAERRPENIMVWDIGGASMQLTHYDGKSFQFHLGKTASVSFKELISSDKSPNPLKPAGAIIAKQKAYRLALEEVPQEFLDKIEGKTVVGIGGVHYYSLRSQMNIKDERPYTRLMLSKALKARSLFSDRKIGGFYAQTDLTNLALVLGYMQAMKIASVYPVKANLTQGMLLTPLKKQERK